VGLASLQLVRRLLSESSGCRAYEVGASGKLGCRAVGDPFGTCTQRPGKSIRFLTSLSITSCGHVPRDCLLLIPSDTGHAIERGQGMRPNSPGLACTWLTGPPLCALDQDGPSWLRYATDRTATEIVQPSKEVACSLEPVTNIQRQQCPHNAYQR
jgi:hypothetical protein